MNSHAGRRNRFRWRSYAGAGVIVAAAVMAAAQSSPAPSSALTSASGHRAKAVVSPVSRSGAVQAAASTQGSCPPYPTYPTSPTDRTQYGVPFTADILGGTVNVGYNEDNGGPGTKALVGMPWFPWLLHLTGLRGTVTGCVPLPGLSLAVQPTDLHVNTYGYMHGPAEIAGRSSATYTFTGIADPWSTSLPLFLDGNFLSAAGAATLNYKTSPAPGPGLTVSDPKFTLEYPYPNTGRIKTVDLAAEPAPGAALTTNIYGGTVQVTNTTPWPISSIAGEESAGFVSLPYPSLPPGGQETATFTFEGSSPGALPNSQALPITFTGEGPSGLVGGSTVAYFSFPSLGIQPLVVTAATMDHQDALHGVATLKKGSVFSGSVTIANNSRTPVTGITGETSQTAQLLVTVAPSGFQEPPLVLGDFSLKVAATTPFAAMVAGARPDGFGPGPIGALDSTASADAFGAFSAASPPLACGEPVSTTLTTGSSTVVPASPAGLPPHPAGPQWTVQGQPIAGPLSGATAQLVSNNFPLKIPYAAPPGYRQQCGFYGELFNWAIGGIQGNSDYYNCPTCTIYGPSGPVDAGAPAGEAQISVDVLLTSVGGLPVCTPSETTAVTCSH